MTRKIADTSREAYARIKDDLATRHEQVLQAIEEMGEASNYQIALYLRLDINQVTGRVTELRKKGAIELVAKIPGRYKVRNQVWRVSEKKPPQPELPEQLTLDGCGT